MNDRDLDRLLAEARTTPALTPSDDFLSRVLADALAEQPRMAAAVPVAPQAAPQRRPGLWAALSASFGGAGLVAGLGCAAMIGLAVGYNNPSALTWLTDDYLSTASGIELVPAADIFMTEG
ncbi:dihydroorotate dehydrogenase [Pseudogemmobacter blasticus]|uniref:Dihydroorotate dehydrogenase n=1 Tax=Fuscovulum blasticum DSM 2131 TaxID=1188250 RepID=A0A2T4J6Q2_FUSBL|nr:dihydroorotate dehydrogenase [Fuscovulum blasticum]PTE13533.1 dihydroorotate dehydrogenase [Fuscovulum blasticum DSM 2131]